MKTFLFTILCISVVVCFLCVSGCKKPVEPEKKNGGNIKPVEPEKKNGGNEKPVTETKKPGTVEFQSIPLGAEVYVDGELKGKTPLSLQLEDGKKYKVEFKNEEFNYETETREIDNKAGLVSVNLRKKRE